MDQLPFISPAPASGWYLDVRVLPGAKKSEIAGTIEGRLKIRLAAPAVENKANKALCVFLGKVLGIRSSKILLVSGDTCRHKRLHIILENPDWTKLSLDKE